MTVWAATAVAFTGEAAGGLDAELARVRVDRGCVGAGCAGAAAEGTPVAIGALGSAARPLVSASGKAGAKTGSVSSVLADVVEVPAGAADAVEAVAATAPSDGEALVPEGSLGSQDVAAQVRCEGRPWPAGPQRPVPRFPRTWQPVIRWVQRSVLRRWLWWRASLDLLG